MPDPVKLLFEEHNRLRRLFKEIFRTARHQSAEDRALTICDQLAIHNVLEEECLYPVIARVQPEIARQAKSEHAVANALVDQIQGHEYTDNDEVKADVGALYRHFDTHALWEEATLLPLVNELDPAEVARIGGNIYRRQQELLWGADYALPGASETEGFSGAPRI